MVWVNYQRMGTDMYQPLSNSENFLTIEIRDVYGKPNAYPLDTAARHFAAIAGTKTVTQQTLIHALGLGFAIVELYRGDIVHIYRATDLHPMCRRIAA
jgi:hypothetical protein